ncbi:uncharacterized protein LOC106655815 [Trichogramma pretiosum]|uniref:uncharacterized protein LOC106655815 n=1 Tax=Trichogramma pretiosum TaxID=7493 RepID=UPI0006C9E140|nr:uncharacterized protein LOC106655815 [Trichogramma pretiosum]
MTRDIIRTYQRRGGNVRRRDSLAQTATLTSLAFFLSSSLSQLDSSAGSGYNGSSSGGNGFGFGYNSGMANAAPAHPVYHNHHQQNHHNNQHHHQQQHGMLMMRPPHHHQVYSESYVDDQRLAEPWLQPCGTPVAAALRKFPQRHSVHRALKRVKTQLRVAQNHFRKDLKDIHEIYAKVYKVLREQYRMNWLPERQLEWYHREVWCLEKGKKAERALPRLHDALQRFAITFHHLREFRLRSSINADTIMIRRNQIIDGMNSEILRMLCEVETAILNLGLQLPSTYKATLVTGSSNWAREGDLTLMLIQDSGVLRLYQAFLNDWIRALRNATATGPGTCDPAMLRPLSNYFKPKKPKKVQKATKNNKNNNNSKKRPNEQKVAKNKKKNQQQQQQQQLKNKAYMQQVRRMQQRKAMRKRPRKMT